MKFNSFRALTVIAAAAALSFAAQAQVSVTSGASGVTSSVSQANGVNQFSSHGAYAQSNNTASASTAGAGMYYNAAGAATTSTTGSTTTGAYGVGAGQSVAGAQQTGLAQAEGTYNAIKPAGYLFGVIPYGNGGAVGSVKVGSTSQVGTQSGTVINNSGIGGAGTNANAWNLTTGAVSAPVPGTSNATGTTLGNAVVSTTGLSTQPGGLSAGGIYTVGPLTNIGALQNGSYIGTITRP